MRILTILIAIKNTELQELLFRYISKCYPNSRIIKVNNTLNLEEYLSASKVGVDICFTEVSKDDPYGIQVAEYFNTGSSRTKIVFISDTDSYALEAWELGVKDYLLKPITIESIQHTVVSCS